MRRSTWRRSRRRSGCVSPAPQRVSVFGHCQVLHHMATLICGLTYHILETVAGRATLVLREKFTDERGDIVDLAIWKVATAPNYPDGVRYRLAFVRRGE